MTIRTTRWRPDTCDCIIDYTWDDTLPQDQIVHNVDNITRKCAAHQHLNNNNVFLAVNNENPRRMKALKEILDRAPSGMYDIDPIDGVTRRLKPGIDINFSFSGVAPDRVITLTLTGYTLTNNQKNTAQTFLDNRFGVGKVILVNG